MLFTLLTISLILVGIPDHYAHLFERYSAERSPTQLGLSPQALAIYIIGLNVFIAMAHNLIASIIFWRKPDDWIALVISYTLVANGAILPVSVLHSHGIPHPSVQLLINFVISVALASSIMVLYIFPNGRFVPYWTILLALTWVPFAITFPYIAHSFQEWPSRIQTLTIMMILGWSVTGVFAQVYRYLNVSNPVQRQQTKWAVLGLTAAVLGPFQYVLPLLIIPAIEQPAVPNLLYQRMGTTFFTFSFIIQLSNLSIVRIATLLFPLSFAIAILRYRLWDIDRLINRALVYTAVTISLALVYFTGVVILQSLFRALTGRGQSEIVTVLSTLAIASLFSPFRRYIQAIIDRHFFRSKYDAAKTLSDFSANLRNEVDLDQLNQQLVSVVEQTMEPETISVWLRPHLNKKSGDSRETIRHQNVEIDN
jgi:hypothetical protein